MFVAHLCSLFVLSCTTCISCLKLRLAVHTRFIQKCQQQTGRVLLNVRMAAAIGRRCVQIFGSIPKRLMDGSKVVLKSGDPTGSRRKALTEEQVDAICRMIEEDQGISLKALEERILADFQLNVAISPIHNYLEGRLLTLKKVHYIAADANNARNKAALHVEYVQAISAHMQDNKIIIWMDKMNVNLYCRRTQGRAPAGQRAAVALLGSKGPNVHVIGAITNSFQIIKWSRLRGTFRSQSAKDWLADMLQHSFPKWAVL